MEVLRFTFLVVLGVLSLSRGQEIQNEVCVENECRELPPGEDCSDQSVREHGRLHDNNGYFINTPTGRACIVWNIIVLRSMCRFVGGIFLCIILDYEHDNTTIIQCMNSVHCILLQYAWGMYSYAQCFTLSLKVE